jgi:hypothetical protein
VGTIFQLHDAPPHFSSRVRASLDRKFHDRWIERGGPIPWEPHFSDLTLLDFFFSEYVKDIVHHEK